MDQIDNWHSEHATNLRNFLESPTGRLSLALLNELRPRYEQGNETNAIVKQTGRQEGYEKALENLALITKAEFLEEPKSKSESYPSLDDDENWDDQDKPTK